MRTLTFVESLPGILQKEKQQFFWDRPTGKTAFPTFL